MIFEEIWFNQDFLKGKSITDLKKEIEVHNLSEAKVKEFYSLLNEKAAVVTETEKV